MKSPLLRSIIFCLHGGLMSLPDERWRHVLGLYYTPRKHSFCRHFKNNVTVMSPFPTHFFLSYCLWQSISFLNRDCAVQWKSTNRNNLGQTFHANWKLLLHMYSHNLTPLCALLQVEVTTVWQPTTLILLYNHERSSPVDANDHSFVRIFLWYVVQDFRRVFNCKRTCSHGNGLVLRKHLWASGWVFFGSEISNRKSPWKLGTVHGKRTSACISTVYRGIHCFVYARSCIFRRNRRESEMLALDEASCRTH